MKTFRPKPLKVVLLLAATMFLLICALASCKATRTITTVSTYTVDRDSTRTITTISTKSTEDYKGQKK